MEAYEALTENLIKEYGDRKKSGRLSIVVDTTNNEIYPVPQDAEHIDFMRIYFPGRDYKPLVPFHIDMENGQIVELTHGQTGLELKLGVTHPHSAINSARTLVSEFLRKGNRVLKSK